MIWFKNAVCKHYSHKLLIEAGVTSYQCSNESAHEFGVIDSIEVCEIRQLYTVTFIYIHVIFIYIHARRKVNFGVQTKTRRAVRGALPWEILKMMCTGAFGWNRRQQFEMYNWRETVSYSLVGGGNLWCMREEGQLPQSIGVCSGLQQWLKSENHFFPLQI